VIVSADPAEELERLCVYRLNAVQAEGLLAYSKRRIRDGLKLTPTRRWAVVILERRLRERRRLREAGAN
jgi:hypothetical protein